MNEFAVRKVCIFTVLLSLVFSGYLFAQTNIEKTDIQVAIIPFSLDTNQPDHQIKNKISLLLSEKLEIEGAKVIISEAQQNVQEWDFAQFRKFGIESGVDYILTGSAFIAGESISIDSRLINVYEKENFTSIYADAENLENLFSAVSKLSKEIVGELFHKKIIIDIAVSGNKRVETDAILRIIESQPGDIIKPSNISRDLKKIYEMGYFDNVVVKKESFDNGIKVVFEITEKSTVRRVKFKENTVYEDKELADIVDTRTGAILNINKLNSDVNRLRLMYTEKNYHNCSVTYDIITLEHSQADIVFTVSEGEKIKVEKITFEGNKYFPDKKIKKAMETAEKGFFSFFTSSGDLNEIEVKNDVIRIESLYQNNGFVDTKVSDPIIDIGEKLISIHFKIDEGDQYKINKIDITGDLILSKKEILKEIHSKTTKLYNRELVRKDILFISDIYAGRGFANVDVTPVVEKNDATKMMDITYSINKGEPVYFNRINISGNLKTRDHVIRREIKVSEQGLYSKKNIEKSFKNLNRLDYFAEIDIKPVNTIDENRMDLDVSVVEKETGSFTFGGGFSSEDAGFGVVSVQERNLFGKGQTGKASAKIAQESILYNLSFFEPYIYGSPVSGGIELYREEKEYNYYDKESFGMTLRLGYKLFDYTRIGAYYNLESFDISDIQTEFTNMISGSFFNSSLKPFIRYDTRNDIFTPTEGGKHEFSIEYAGELLGGEIDYTKFLVESGIYFPIFWKFTGTLHAEAGFLDDRSGNNINIDYIKFYLGGMNSVRGFDKYDINVNEEGDSKDTGGDKYVQFNAEITLPLTDKYKIVGVFFYDRGDVYKAGEDIDFEDQFSSFGTGIRWNSPVGPLRIEYAWVIEGKNVKNRGDGQFEFTVGASF